MAVAIARLTPGLLTPSTVAAGCAKVSWVRLTAGIVIASIVADGVLVLFGFATRRGLKVAGVEPAPWQGLLAFILIFIAIFLVRRYWPRKRAQA